MADEFDLGYVATFTLTYAVENEAITQNVKEWYWLQDGVPYIDIIEKLKKQST